VARRTQPLSAPAIDADEQAGALPVSEVDLPAPEEVDPQVVAARDRRFDEGLRTLRVGGADIVLSERILMVVGGVIAPLGLLVILVGWYGAARTGLLFEQVPYLISGGLFGLALVFLGAFFYFAHWLTELVKEHRGQSAAVVDAIRAVESRVAALADLAVVAPTANGSAAPGASAAPAVAAVAVGPSATEPDVELVATARGTMAHLPHCAVVAGKTDLRPVGDGAGLERCRLCQAG
jgi:hypothetical protein